MYDIVKKLINKHYYTKREQAEKIVDIFFSVGKLTVEEYTELMMLIDERYPLEITEEAIENAVEGIDEEAESVENTSEE